MDINTASFIIALLSLIVAIPQFVKWAGSRKPTIFLVIDYNINLFQQITKGIDGLSISYNNEPINKNSNLLKAFICYIGSQDVEKEKIIKTVYLELPKNVKVIAGKIIDQTEGLDVLQKVSFREINFKFDLLKIKIYSILKYFLNVILK